MNKFILSCLLTALVGASAARASIICLAPTVSANGSITITAPISFTITTTASAQAFVFDEWVTSDGNRTLASITPQLAYSVNNGTSGSLAAGIADNFASTGPAATPNDGYLYFTGSSVPVQAGSTLTLLAGTYTIAAANNFNPQATQTFNGNLFVGDTNGNRISNFSAAPEPSTWATLGLGAASVGMMVLRRRRVAA